MNENPGERRRKDGENLMAIACRHIVRAVDTMSVRQVGFHRAASDRKRFPNAWCTSCDKALARSGGEWTPAMLERADFKTLCPCCYEFQRMASEPGAIVESVRWR